MKNGLHAFLYTQAPAETNLDMQLPKGIIENVWQPQGWNQYLINKLSSIGFKYSGVDESAFYPTDLIFIVHVDVLGLSDKVLN